MRAFLVTLLALVAAVPAGSAAAATSDWHVLEPGTQVRLVSSDRVGADGTTLVGLEIHMPETTKTYWRVPGETGIPARFDISGSEGVSGHEVLWPYPTIESTSGFTDYVYYGPTVLPFEVQVTGNDPILRLSALLGICSDICIPVDVSFELPLDFSVPDNAQALKLAQAVARTPIDWTDPRQPLGDVSFDTAQKTLAVTIGDPDVDPLSVIVDAGTGGPLFGAPQKSPDGRLVLLPLLGDGDAGDIEGKVLVVTFMTPMGPFEVTRRVAPSTRAGL